ncbi:uncharacterized protein [Antedon mediterranea]|uniref:uncharacterized protein n=2 Tax=Antedon mediterranea TaxID=105859 RepID=UPI003AF48B51
MEIFDSDSDDLAMLSLWLNKKRERQWVNIVNKKRKTHGQFETLVREDLEVDPDKFFNFFRMTQVQFEILFDLIKDDISKTDTNFRKSITPRERLAICLRFLASGDSYTSLHYNFRVGISTISAIVLEVADAIWKKLQPVYMAPPTKDEWADISADFERRWNFPNCVGAIDGKHVTIKAPGNSGSLFYNYKGTYSIVLMALVDANYNFICVDVGNYGSSSDGGIFSRMQLKIALEENTLGIPPPKVLPDMPELGPVPHVIVGDEAFPLKTNVMRPYPGKKLDREKRIYNYRHSRARRISENVFGILANKFRIFHRKLELKPANVDKVVLCATVLHNFIRKTGPTPMGSDDPDISSIESVEGLLSLEHSGFHSSKDAIDVREKLCKWFSSDVGIVSWQDRLCFGHAAAN